MSRDEFHYRLARRARGLRPGQHRGRQLGDGLETYTHVELLGGGDPRRLDLLASVRDPWRRLLLRRARPPVSVPVYLLADLSASMGAGRAVKLQMLADFTAALAQSVHRSGDSFAFLGGDSRLRRDFVHPPGRSRGTGMDLARRLRRLEPGGHSADGLLEAASLIARKEALVFLVSDFHMDPRSVHALLDALSRHQVVPVVLCDSAETAAVTARGIARLRDVESGHERTVVLTRAMGERVRREGDAHRERLAAVFRRHGTAALWLTDRFDADRVTEHFHA